MANDPIQRRPSLRASLDFTIEAPGNLVAYAAASLTCLVAGLVWHATAVPARDRTFDFSLFGFVGLCMTAFFMAEKPRSKALRRSLKIAPLVAAASLLALICVGSVEALSAILGAIFEPVLNGWHLAVSALDGTRVIERVVASTPEGSGLGSVAIVAILLATGRPLWLAVYMGCKVVTGVIVPKAVQMAGSVASFSPLQALYDHLDVDAPARPDLSFAVFLSSPGESLDRAIHPYMTQLGLGGLSCPTLDQIFFLALAWTVRKTPLGWPAVAAAAVAILWSTRATGHYVTDVAIGAAFAFTFMAVFVIVLAAFLREATAVYDDGILAAEAEALDGGRTLRSPPAVL